MNFQNSNSVRLITLALVISPLAFPVWFARSLNPHPDSYPGRAARKLSSQRTSCPGLVSSNACKSAAPLSLSNRQALSASVS